MSVRALVFAVLCLSACASNDQPAPETVNWPSGCFEFPIGKNPDGGTPVACTATNGQDSDQQDDSKTDDEQNETKTD